MMKRSGFNQGQKEFVVVIDERGARCVGRVPRRATEKDLLIEHGLNGTVVCRKVQQSVEIASFDEKDDEVLDHTEELIPTRFSKLDRPLYRSSKDRLPSRRYYESRSHEQGKRQLPRRTDNARFNLARHAESLVETYLP